ncbi:MAG: PP2C family protein-serine/threonine phosphatase, partial [Lachnospiraceae bacterium]|nr:PP2C family protein-serine/threonine phosphatase [Lachnospiraceae bacterium]
LRMNEMKRVYNAAYLYFLASDDSFEESIFIITASDGTRERGTGPENSYILGKTVQNIPDQTAAFKGLKEGEDHLVYTDGLMDRYRYLFRIGDMNVLTGMTFEVAAIEQDVAKQTLQGINNFSVLQILLSVFCLFLIYLFAIRPLQKVRMNVLEYGDTKDSAKVKAQLEMISSNNEIGELAEGVSEMITEIDEHLEYIQSITAEKERISTELELATNIQTSMLPHIFPAFPGRSEFDIYASMDPAKEVGGDFYDYFLVDDDHLCMVIADVSGKGIPAALFMMISKIILQNCTMLGQTASQVLAKTNDIICSNNEAEMFVTVWLGILELSTGRMTAANAGHEYPAIRRAGGSFALFIDKHDFVIGAFEGIKYHEYELQLQPGDKLFVYTDGVPEATNAEKELFGTDRMLGALNTDPEAGPYDILMNVQSDVDSFVGEAEQFDDLTMLCMEYKGKQDR